jgi:hypothetical protein
VTPARAEATTTTGAPSPSTASSTEATRSGRSRDVPPNLTTIGLSVERSPARAAAAADWAVVVSMLPLVRARTGGRREGGFRISVQSGLGSAPSRRLPVTRARSSRSARGRASTCRRRRPASRGPEPRPPIYPPRNGLPRSSGSMARQFARHAARGLSVGSGGPRPMWVDRTGGASLAASPARPERPERGTGTGRALLTLRAARSCREGFP